MPEMMRPGQRADVGAPVAADLRLVPDAAQGHLHELPVDGLRDGAHDGGLADAGRADEAQDRPAHDGVLLRLVPKSQDGQVFDDALLDLLEAVVVLVQDLPGAFDIQVVLGILAPGQVQDPLHIGLGNDDLRAAGGHAVHPAELLFTFFLGLLVQRGFLHPLPVSALVVRVVALAQLRLDGPDLLPEVIVLLVLFHLLREPALDLLLRVRQIRFPHQHGAELLQPLRRDPAPPGMSCRSCHFCRMLAAMRSAISPAPPGSGWPPPSPRSPAGCFGHIPQKVLRSSAPAPCLSLLRESLS